MIGILTDSASDTPSEIKNKDYVEVVPLRVYLGEKSYKDNVEIDEKTCLEYMEHDFAKTSLTPYPDVIEGFHALIEKGYDEIIAINVSSNISGTHNVFRMAIEEINRDYPNVKVNVIDTLNISIGSGLLVCKASELLEEGVEYEPLVKELKSYVPEGLSVHYVIPTLKFLKAGGRIGYVSGTIAEILNIKPVISVGNDGVYHTAGKARGIKKSVEKMMEIIDDMIQGKTIEAFAIYHSGDSELTMNCIELVKDMAKRLNVKRIYMDKIVPSMLVHVGPGLVGIAVRMK